MISLDGDSSLNLVSSNDYESNNPIFFESDTSCLLNLLLKLLLLKWLICENGYLKFITIWSTKEIIYTNCLHKSRKKCCFYWFGYIYYLFIKHKILHLFRLRFCLQRFVVSLCTTYPTVVAFMVRKIISLNYNFSILSQVGLIKLTVYLSICYLKWIGTPPYRLYRLYRYSQILKTAHYHWW